MSGKYLLDTNIIIALFADDVVVKDKLETADEVFLPSIAIGELYFGARKSERLHENLRRIDEFAANSVVLECNAETARWYGQIKNTLRVKGHPIPENDITNQSPSIIAVRPIVYGQCISPFRVACKFGTCDGIG